MMMMMMMITDFYLVIIFLNKIHPAKLFCNKVFGVRTQVWDNEISIIQNTAIITVVKWQGKCSRK